VSQVQLPPFFYEIFAASLPRLNCGDDASTRKALETLLALRASATGESRVLDIGCGNGAPTLQLARHTNGTITAVDNHEPYLRELAPPRHGRGAVRPDPDMPEGHADAGSGHGNLRPHLVRGRPLRVGLP
jgi:SAM-dependent methyltransferase